MSRKRFFLLSFLAITLTVALGLLMSWGFQGPSANPPTGGGLIFATSSKVGIGTMTPGQKLTVAGVIESTSGGFKFPDSTTQTTAATAGTNYWTLSGSSLYPTSTTYNVGVGNTNPGYTLDVSGNIRATSQVRAEVAAGTAPFVVNSTTLVANLNADLLDGLNSSAFGDATLANQTTILTKIGTNADAAAMDTTLFGGQQYIWDNRASFGDFVAFRLVQPNTVCPTVSGVTLWGGFGVYGGNSYIHGPTGGAGNGEGRICVYSSR